MGNKWPRYTLGEVCKFKYGQMPRKDDLCDDGYPVFSGYRIVGHARTYHYEEPEIIVVARGVGGTGDVKMSPPRCFLTNLSIVAKVVSSEVDKKFLYYRLAGPKLWELRTGSAQAQITIDILQRYELRLPPLPIQQKIASILSAYDDLIENNTRRIKILEQMAQTIYREWFVNFRFPGYKNTKFGNSTAGKIPEGWEVRSINELRGASLISDNVSFFCGKKKYYATADINGLDIVGNGIEYEYANKPSRAQKQPIENSVWFARMKDTYKVLVFTSVNKESANNMMISSGFLGLLAKNKEYLGYLFFTINSNVFHEQKNLHCTGTTQVSLTNEGMNAIKHLEPSQDIIVKYGQSVNPIIDDLLVLQTKNKNLRLTRDLLLPRLISGDVDVERLKIEV
jgi:type I restriction enzyme S subunit